MSRTHKGFLQRLFELEVPEIHSGTVEIKAIAREAGSRSKVAVASRQDGLDPVGATVGQRGARVQAVVAELAGEKIDVIPWNDDPAVFVANALSPAQVLSVDIDEEHRIANVTVPERMLSLAIGREGQNARLAARLTGWRIDIRSDVSVAEAKAAAEPTADAAPARRRGARPPRHRRAEAAVARRAAAAERDDEAAAEGATGRRDRPRPRRRGASRGARRPRRRVDARTTGAEAASATAAEAEPRRPKTAASRSARGAKAAADASGRRAPDAEEAAPKRAPPPRRWRRRPARAPTDAAARVPTRSCVACRTVRPKRELLRIVRTPDGTVGDRRDRPARRSRRLRVPRRRLPRPSPSARALGRALETPLPDATLRSRRCDRHGDHHQLTHRPEGGARGQE